jgi:hypothetical protein
MVSHIKKCFRLRLKKQKMLICISFLYNRVELNIFLSHLKDFSFLKKSLFATIIKTKIAKNKAICEALTINLLKSNEITTTKKIVNIHKCKNRKCTNKSKKVLFKRQ